MAHEERGGHGGAGTSVVDCDEAVRQLYSYLDGELTEERRGDIERHLEICGPCAEAADFEAELRVIISSRCRDRVPDTLVQRIAIAIAAEDVGMQASS